MGDRLRLHDVRTVFRLIGEVRELGSDPAKWRTHLVRRLHKLLRAELVISSEVHVHKPAANAANGTYRVTDVGWGCDGGGEVWQTTSENDAKPEQFMLAIASDTADAAGDLPVRPSVPLRGGSSFVMSQYPLPHIGAVDQLSIYKDVTKAAFSKGQHKLIRLFHVELGRLWTHDAIDRAKDPNSELPPRLAQTLAALQAGCSEKEVGVRLGISPHTVHNYVKALHQRFGVSSRGELLAKMQPTQTGFVPQFSVKR